MTEPRSQLRIEIDVPRRRLDIVGTAGGFHHLTREPRALRKAARHGG
jgi:hypothetical protein